MNTTICKFARSDDISVELFKGGGDTSWQDASHMRTITGIRPKDWTKSVSILLTGKGDLEHCSNYWIIALVSHATDQSPMHLL